MSLDWQAIAIGTVLFGGVLWASIKLLEPANHENSLGLALIVGAAFAFTTPHGLFVAIPLVGLMYLLLGFYDMGFIKGLAVIAAMAALAYFGEEVISTIRVEIDQLVARVR
jgi:hypothetical protein